MLIKLIEPHNQIRDRRARTKPRGTTGPNSTNFPRLHDEDRHTRTVTHRIEFHWLDPLTPTVTHTQT
jgi:hypothetical protein